jgi:hypothetical protein
MKKLLSIAFICICICTSYSQTTKINQKEFAKNYFAAYNKTQTPDATAADIENYLIFLTDDVALQHFPYDITDVREPNGKENIRKGMTRYLGGANTYTSKLIDIMYGHDVIIIKYKAVMTLLDKTTQKETIITRNMVDALELDNGKISIIRKYGKILVSKK